MARLLLVLLLMLAAPLSGCGQETPEQAGESDYYEIETPLGLLIARMYDGTPLHRANFEKLVSEAFYDSTTFHRVISGFMIQGGDPNSKDDDLANDGQGSPGYTVPAEFNPAYIHKRGAISGARLGDAVNPTKASSGSQFFIVHGGFGFSDEQLDQVEIQKRMATVNPAWEFSTAAREAYTTVGGAPHLDGEYTVFGEIVEGFDVLDAIAESETLRKRIAQGDPTLSPQTVDPALMDQPPTRIWMVVRRLAEPPQSVR
jgi:cyclophilin family peptidyl-prolyl cis-trans isomerase